MRRRVGKKQTNSIIRPRRRFRLGNATRWRWLAVQFRYAHLLRADMNDPVLVYSLVALAAFGGGLMNAIAGGGTLLTFPALLLAGPRWIANETVANITSTVALLPGSLAGVWGFRREIRDNRAWVLFLLAPSIVGGILGSLLLVLLPNKVFAALVPWLVLTAALLFLVQPLVSRFAAQRPTGIPHHPVTLGVLIGFQFLVALYGGYFGAGIGIMMLASLGFMGVGDIRALNGVKNLLAALINGLSVIVFVSAGGVVWSLALLMMGTAMLGGLTGAWLGRRLPPMVVRGVVVCIGFGVAGYGFWKQFAGA